jgi:hypothetical protein
MARDYKPFFLPTGELFLIIGELFRTCNGGKIEVKVGNNDKFRCSRAVAHYCIYTGPPASPPAISPLILGVGGGG